MGKSLIQTTNQTSQAVEENGIISLGSVLRRFGCNCRLSGNAIEIVGQGYYTVDVDVTDVPTGAGAVTIALYNNNVQVASAIAYGTGEADSPLSLHISTTIRQMCCDSTDNLAVVLLEGAGQITNVSVRVVKQ